MSTQTTYYQRRGRFYATRPWGIEFAFDGGAWWARPDLPVWGWSQSLDVDLDEVPEADVPMPLPGR